MHGILLYYSPKAVLLFAGVISVHAYRIMPPGRLSLVLFSTLCLGLFSFIKTDFSDVEWHTKIRWFFFILFYLFVFSRCWKFSATWNWNSLKCCIAIRLTNARLIVMKK